jgi:two-component system response regulator MprA
MPPLPELKDRRLLIVDDAPEDRRTLGALARSRGCVVREAVDLREMNAIRREWEPELLILDVVMPAPDGLAILRHLSEGHCRTPMILVSAHVAMLSPARNLGRVYGARIVDAMVKPIGTAAFTAALRKAFSPIAARAGG